MEYLGLTTAQVLTVAGIALLLSVLLFVLKVVFKLTKNLLGLGCVGIIILVIVAVVALQVLPG